MQESKSQPMPLHEAFKLLEDLTTNKQYCSLTFEIQAGNIVLAEVRTKIKRYGKSN